MMTRGKFVILLALTIFTMALTAVPASAIFVASSGKYPVTIDVKSNAIQKFTVGTSLATECSTVSTVSSLLGEGSQLTAAPTYSGCKGKVGTSELGNVKVITNGCIYNFHQARGHAEEGTVSIECPSGKSIEFEAIAGCLIKVGSANNANLGTIKFVNEGSGPTEEVKLEPSVKGIHYHAKGCLGLVKEEPSEGNDAVYEGVVLVLGTRNGAQTGILVL